MPQSFSDVLVHLVFSTKYRARVLDPELRLRLYDYLTVVAADLKCPAVQVGGIEDHVHLLVVLARTRTIAEVVEKLKVSSSKWMKQQAPQHEGFQWQTGYSAFSVSESGRAGVVTYIQNQELHHQGQDFQTEYRSLLTKHGVVYDERYMWD
jgi:REP element-mobilizing transposase RayT